ncbi:TPA: hypothetical protein ACP32N_003189 [Pseudomonas aeruginosa]
MQANLFGDSELALSTSPRLGVEVDLFGNAISNPTVEKPKAVRKPTTKIVIDRKALWSNSGYLSGLKELDEDDDVLEATTTSDTRSDNSTIERLEKALGLSPVIKDGKWQTDELGYLYRRVGKPFKGKRVLGKRGSMVWELNRNSVLSSARDALEPVFTDPCCWLITNSVHVLAIRLRMMEEDEDPFACLQAFLQVMTQHDFIDNSRKGETIRSLTKRDQMREKRAAARKAKEEKPLSKALMSDMESDDFTDDDNE